MLAGRVAAVVEVPELGALAARVPGAERVAQAEDALLGAGLLLVTAATAEDGVELVGLDGVEQRDGLERVPGTVRTLTQAAVVDVVLHVGHDQTKPEAGDRLVAVVEHLGEVVAGVDVQQRERWRRRGEGLDRQVQHDDGVLATAEQHHGPLELAGDLAEDVDRLRLEVVEVVQRQRDVGRDRAVDESGHVCSPHSVLARPDQRPARGSSPSATARVHGAHPMEANPICRSGFSKTPFSCV